MSGALYEATYNYLANYDLPGATDYELRVLLVQHVRRAGFDANSEKVVIAVRAEQARRSH
jgi:hypothetical protein